MDEFIFLSCQQHWKVQTCNLSLVLSRSISLSLLLSLSLALSFSLSFNLSTNRILVHTNKHRDLKHTFAHKYQDINIHAHTSHMHPPTPTRTYSHWSTLTLHNIWYIISFFLPTLIKRLLSSIKTAQICNSNYHFT